MKKIQTLLISFLLFNSCESSEIKKLHKQVSELKNVNDKLADSIRKLQHIKLTSSNLILIPQEEPKLKLNKSNKFTAIFFQNVNFPKYDVYEIRKD